MSSFKKQEYIHLHALLEETVEYLETREEGLETVYEDIEDVESYQDYLDLDVSATAVQRNKKDHKEAVFALTEAITDFLEGEEQSLTP